MRSNGSLNKQTIQILGDSEISELEKVKKIGRGATSEVYEVVQKKRFALKVLDVEFLKKKIQEEGSDEETKSKDDDYDEENQNKNEININKLKQFVKESEVLNQLDHKNIVKMFGFFFGNDHQEPAILLEYCESNLKRRVKKLSKEDRRRIIVELSSAMKEVHRVGIIHRDLKLENILLDSKNRVKVSDFGLCTFIKSDDETMSHTQMAGSLKYMAPEILQGRTDYDEKVDVYSFGVVVFLILTKGEFPSINVVDVGTGKQAQIPSNISEFSRKLILDCWSFKSKDRPSFFDIVSRLRGNEDKLI